jgi:ectoine hydroxylase-related dioxygenase (phytanoyl-CoA dioxygenase family)
LASVVQHCVPVEAPAGSVLLFHGACWHGAFPKATPGLRLSVNCYYCQSYMKPQERFVGKVSKEVLERNPKKLAEILGFEDVWGHEDRRGPVKYSLRGYPFGHAPEPPTVARL